MLKPVSSLLVCMTVSISLSACQSGALSQNRLQPSPSHVNPLAQIAQNDLNFRPRPNGFSFENGSGAKYNPEQPETRYLSLKGLQTMFGDPSVCTGKTRGDDCRPTPVAERWLDEINTEMNSGQCEGIAVLSLTLFKGLDSLANLEPGTADPFDLSYNKSVREKIGYYYAYQYTDNVSQAMFKGRPSDVLNRLARHLSQNQSDPVTLGFYGIDGGHATTPYAIKAIGKGKYHILMYDNNWPGKERYIEIDTLADTWVYNYAATNPTELSKAWTGKGESNPIEITPLSARLKPAGCPFCSPGSASDNPSRQIWLLAGDSGKARIRVVNLDQPNQFIGWDPATDRYVNRLDGAAFQFDKSILADGEAQDIPMIKIPAGKNYEVILDGDDLNKSESVDISIYGSGKVLKLENIDLDPDQQDSLKIAADGDSLEYRPGGPDVEAPNIILSLDEKDHFDYDFTVINLEAQKGERLILDLKENRLQISDTGNQSDTYDLEVERFDENGKEIEFSKDNIAINRAETHDVEFKAWPGQGSSMSIGPDGRENQEPDIDSESND